MFVKYAFCTSLKAVLSLTFRMDRLNLFGTAAAKYNVSAMPTFVFIKGGEVVDRLMGANAARLQELIDEHSQ